MGQVLVRNLDEQVIEALKARAELHGRPLEQELRDILSAAARPTPAERAAMADRIRALTLPKPQTDSTALVRDERDRR